MVSKARTKIVATIGPASSTVTMLTRMIKAGMDVARLNFSHGTYDDHEMLMKHIRSAARKTGERVTILQDLQGTKIRVGVLPDEGIELKKNQAIEFEYSENPYDGDIIPVTYTLLHRDVKKGHRIFLDDGLIELHVISIRGKKVKAKVILGGTLLSNKGINIPDSVLTSKSFTKKDHEDLLFGMNHHVDWIALSFVTDVNVVTEVRKIIQNHAKKHKLPEPKIMVKIERREAVESFLNLLEVVDGVLIARGDLGIEIPFEEVPIIQKEFVEICRAAGKPVIVATHMLDSMTKVRRATRSEVSDVANAVFDHTDAVMLSAETATGDFPYASVQVMETVIREAEASRMDDISFYRMHEIHSPELAIAQSVHVMAENGQIDAIVTSANYGTAPQKINVFRPNVPIFMACKDESQARQVMMKSGVQSFVLDDAPGSFVHRSMSALRRKKLIQAKQKIAFVIRGPKGDLHLSIH